MTPEDYIECQCGNDVPLAVNPARTQTFTVACLKCSTRTVVNPKNYSYDENKKPASDE